MDNLLTSTTSSQVSANNRLTIISHDCRLNDPIKRQMRNPPKNGFAKREEREGISVCSFP